jgi:serine/threonine protein kinase
MSDRLCVIIPAGMLFLHEHGVCHRDLKSANVLFNRHLEVKLCDFAFSKFKQQASMSARFETSVGTPAWMAPEVLRGDEYTLLADVYSFGVILWEVVCRRAPFESLNRFQIIFQVGTQGVKLEFPAGTAQVWEEISHACWREKPPGTKSRRPTFRQIVDVLSATQEQMKAGVGLSDGAGMNAWERAEAVREEEHAKYCDRFSGGTAPIDLPALHAGCSFEKLLLNFNRKCVDFTPFPPFFSFGIGKLREMLTGQDHRGA